MAIQYSYCIEYNVVCCPHSDSVFWSMFQVPALPIRKILFHLHGDGYVGSCPFSPAVQRASQNSMLGTRFLQKIAPIDTEMGGTGTLPSPVPTRQSRDEQEDGMQSPICHDDLVFSRGFQLAPQPVSQMPLQRSGLIIPGAGLNNIITEVTMEGCELESATRTFHTHTAVEAIFLEEFRTNTSDQPTSMLIYDEVQPIAPNFQRRGRFLIWPVSSLSPGHEAQMTPRSRRRRTA